MKNYGIILLSIFLLSCSKTDNNEGNTYWVNSAKIKCVGVGPMQCLQVQKSETLDLSGEWNLFYSNIEGFEYEPGFIYKISVKEVALKNVPADASSIKYTLINVLEKKHDKRLNIHDIWVLKSLNGKEIKTDSTSSHPQMEINVTEMRVMGTNGCNTFTGSINKLNDNQLEFGALAQTRKMCINMEIPSQFSKALTETKSYKKDGTNLYLLNELGEETLIFRKTD